jgi:hypothetical protein
MVEVATNLIVPGRGHNVWPDGSLHLSESAWARVDTAVEYVRQHQEAFEAARESGTGGVVVMSGGYAALATGGKMEPPPFERRESTLMYQEGRRLRIPSDYLRNSPASTSTLENILRPYEEGYFPQLSEENPLGIVTQEYQYDRFEWFACRIFRLPTSAVRLIRAPGEDDPAIARDEQNLLRATRIFYGPFHSPTGLRVAEAALGGVSRAAVALKLQRPPAERYSNAGRI